jgi:hypothetical protein
LSGDDFWDHVGDWFKILLRSGVPALMIGLGWISTTATLFLYGSSANSNLAFWVGIGIGVLMIVLGYRLYKIELERLSRTEKE